MSVYDVRTDQNENTIDTIIFAGTGGLVVNVTELKLEAGSVCIVSEDGDVIGYIETREDADRMITALKKAMSLGWWE